MKLLEDSDGKWHIAEAAGPYGRGHWDSLCGRQFNSFMCAVISVEPDSVGSCLIRCQTCSTVLAKKCIREVVLK